ncbi:zinc finger domain-containing protein [Hirsutella rhossiliensis]|uniref:Zinc finger domain-containing protein n=1 Tax=Hirsutella rhossiliensis TaxID=111463 RepID=A0A9P8MN52_9HYPO|nr:zinc finger domain-containing protein [Hirsutella rhossiliensis]KAH0958074.1 zinc finger domain-containing protein [Hirsutella rhossiliensis]
MSVAYEPRSFIHEGAYPSIGDDHDHHVAEQRYTDSDVAEHLGHYTAEASILDDERQVLAGDGDVMGDDGGIIPDDDDDTAATATAAAAAAAAASVVAAAAQDAERLGLDSSTFPSPIHMPLASSLMADEGPLESNDLSPGAGSPSSVSRSKPIPKPDRDVMKQADGKYHCPLPDCKEDVNAFSRKCEWNKHMDKHERPYRCPADGCENLPGFTYSGGLLRHEREVHGKHGGPKNTVNCPHPNCKRHTGKGFSRQENLNEHLRRVHTHMDGSTPPAVDSAASPEDNESEKSGAKRKRRQSDAGNDEAAGDLRDEVKRLREENAKLKAEVEQQSEHSLAMMAQIAELQETLRQSLTQQGLAAPTAQMI